MFDVAIIGGGPAGAAAAKLLGDWGHSVTVLTRSERHRPPLAESLPPSSRKLFDLVGLLPALDRAGFMPTRGNTVWWGDDAPRIESFGDGAVGYQVLRDDLERLLLTTAKTSGATVWSDHAVRRVDLEEADGGSRLTVESSAGPSDLRARWVLDCSGRAGVIARRDRRRMESETKTLALVGMWRRSGTWDFPDPSHTLVESYRDGWAWSVPTTPDTRFVTVMVDPRRTALAPARDLAVRYHAELGKTTHLHALTTRARLIEGPFGCDASRYAAPEVAGPGFLLVGDAASFLDPMSSFGVKKAIASAWLAAVVVHTCLLHPERRGAALTLFTTREHEMYESYSAIGARLYRAAADDHGHDYWTARAEADPDIAATRPALAPDAEVRAAFHALKRSPSIRLRLHPSVTTDDRPVVRDRLIVPTGHLVGPMIPSGLRYLRNVDVTRLVELAATHDQVPDLFEAYNRHEAPVTLPDFLGALSTLLAAGVLVNTAGSPGAG